MEVDENTSSKLKQLCVEFLGDQWSNGLKIQQVECGIVNQIFRCIVEGNGVSKSVVVRLPATLSDEYAIKELETDLNDEFQIHSDSARIIICAILAEAGIGPKLLGVFEGGRIEEFIEGRNMVIEDLNDPSMYSVIAKKVAKFHSLKVPIGRTMLLEFFTKFTVKLPEPDYTTIEAKHVKYVKELFQLDMTEELQWLLRNAPKIKSKIVFTHNDLHLNNIILKSSEEVNDNKVVFVDFDMCTYSYRGYDFAFFLGCHEFRVLPDRKQIIIIYTENRCPEHIKQLFVEEYLKEFQVLNPSVDETDCYDHIFMEIEFFTLQFYFTLISFSQFLFSNTVRKIPYDHIPHLLKRFKEHKQFLIEKYGALFDVN